MKVVGIVGRADMNDETKSFECLESYTRIFSRYDDVVPIMILPVKDMEYKFTRVRDECKTQLDKLSKLDKVLDMCDGFLIPGGNKWYSHDEYVVNYAIKNDKPLLGICLGMQILGIVDNRINFGIFDETILNNTKINHYQKDVDFVHKVKVIEGGLLSKILGTKEFKVNSRHNFHIGGVVNSNVDAVSEDGIIEAISYPNKKFILGVQWHPENLIDKSEVSVKIFDAFINSLR